MNQEQYYPPEGTRLGTEENRALTYTLDGLRSAMAAGRIVEGLAESCDQEHNLIVRLGNMHGIIPRSECAIGIASGETREIAILSRVGKPVSFIVTQADSDRVLLSRRAAQERALTHYLQVLAPGDVIPASVTHLEPFGAFVDIGCGIISFIGIENISVSRIFHPKERFSSGQNIYAVVLGIDEQMRRITLSHRELLGSWEENAALFHAGETVRGIVRSIESYGIFVELTPNLSGLAERRSGLHEGDPVSVYIKSILPERMKIKLSLIDELGHTRFPPAELRYFVTDGHLSEWIYSPAACESKYIATIFA